MIRRLLRTTTYGLGCGLLLGLLAGSLAACDSVNNTARDAEPAPASPATAVDELGRTLNLSQETVARMKTAFAAHEGQAGDPGYLWYVAADLQEKLTPDQKAAFFDRLQARNEKLRAGRRDERSAPRRQRRDRDAAFAEALDLTPAQRAAVDSIRTAYAAQRKTLKHAQGDDAADPGAVRDQMRTLQEEMRRDIDAVLTDAQRDRIEARKERRQDEIRERRAFTEEKREQARTVAADVLDLTEQQQQALSELAASGTAMRRTRRADRDTRNTTRDETAEAARALREARIETLSATLTTPQLEIVRIYRALAFQTMHRHRKAGRAR